MLSRGLSPLGTVGSATAVVCNATAAMETNHDILIKSSNVGLFRLSSTAMRQRTDRHVENKSREGGSLPRVLPPYHWPIPLDHRASPESVYPKFNKICKLFQENFTKRNLQVLPAFGFNELILQKYVVFVKKKLHYPYFLGKPAISFGVYHFFKRCEIKKGYTSSSMPSIDIYSIPHFQKKIKFFAIFLVMFYFTKKTAVDIRLSGIKKPHLLPGCTDGTLRL